MIAIGARVRIRTDRLYLVEANTVLTGVVTDRHVPHSDDMPMLRILRDGQRLSEEWSENFWELET